ncbi:MAG: Glutamyl-tRNA(Gln) amidotransferase subunit A [Microgenomates bacterium OLB23]|nr:MAG: Glutamyl-tRNA(Gln) amidotransferase subunit A [Microgenomates bacterium OLB23]
MAPYAATITNKLALHGATIMGKTNLDAWAHGSSTETSDFGPSRNPYHTDYVPGGSSGGSAVAVAAGLIPAAIGTETAGSIRLPAAWSGVVGLKPSYGRVSRYGIVAMGSSWDCPGPITQTVEDAALLLEVMAGHDVHDATSINAPVPQYVSELSQPRKLSIGISEEYFANVDAEIMQSVEKSIKLLEDLGHTIKKIKLMEPKYAISVYMLLQRSEVASNLARYDGIRFGKPRSFFGKEAERRILLGTYALSAGYYDAFYKKAQKVRYLIREDFEKVFTQVDVIFAPTTPITATKLGDCSKFAFYGEMMDVLTEPASAAGIPAISIPIGMHSNGLPIGGQFMANYLDEQSLLQAAYQLEQNVQFDRLSVMQKYE